MKALLNRSVLVSLFLAVAAAQTIEAQQCDSMVIVGSNRAPGSGSQWADVAVGDVTGDGRNEVVGVRNYDGVAQLSPAPRDIETSSPSGWQGRSSGLSTLQPPDAIVACYQRGNKPRSVRAARTRVSERAETSCCSRSSAIHSPPV